MTNVFLSGDSRYFWQENIGDFAILPSAWDNILNTGIGQSQIGSLWITSYLNFTAFFSKLGLSWNLIGLIFWILPAILLSFFSSFSLFNYLFSRERDPAAAGKDKIKYSLLAGIIYTFNTYFLMILTGGQLGVALSYSIAPLVLVRFIKLIDNLSSQSYNLKFHPFDKLRTNLKLPIMAGLVLGLQILFDPRIVYITLLAVFLYLIFSARDVIKIVKSSFFIFITPFVIGILLHSYWILPLILTKSSALPSGFNSAQGFEFFSFADFSHSLSLLHPNWPENIFGKVYFLKPEFLILPIIAFSALLFTKNKTILFFSSLALLGSFLAKGANPPFGQINVWLFQHFPGMVMFRDPTKWYILVALSYSILIPFSIWKIYELLKSHNKFSIFNFQFSIKNKIFNFQNLFLILTFLYLLFLVRPLWIGEFREKFRPKIVPVEYVQLKDFLSNQNGFSRTLWVPQWQRFGYFSNNHPAMGREEIFKGNSKNQIKQLKESGVDNLLRDLSVKYIIVPYDSEGEIFLKDRKYDNKLYQETVDDIRKIRWLKEVDGFGKIKVFETQNHKDHFWSPPENIIKNYKYINPTKYTVDVRNAKKGDILVFAESFDKYWTLKSQISPASPSEAGRANLRSQKYHELFNSFVFEENGNYSAEIYYEPQKWVDIGVVISLATLISVLGFLGFGLMGRKW